METKDAARFLGRIGANFVAFVDGANYEELKKRKNQKDQFGNTLLIYAAAKNRIDVVEMLLREEVGLHFRNMAGESAIEHAAKMGHTEVCLRLLKECRQRAPYVQAAVLAAANNHVDFFSQLVVAYPWLLTDATLTAALLGRST